MTNLKPSESKGVFGGKCNRTACQKSSSAIYYNHSTCKYYCEKCAHLINRCNRKEAMEHYHHDLCTLGENTQ